MEPENPSPPPSSAENSPKTSPFPSSDEAESEIEFIRIATTAKARYEASKPPEPKPIAPKVHGPTPEQLREAEEYAAELKRREEDNRRYQAAQRARDLWRVAKVPVLFEDARLDRLGDIEPNHREAADKLAAMADFGGMYALVGVRGAGKTHLACALVHEFCRLGKSAVYHRTMDIFLDIKRTFDKGNGSQADVVERYAKPKLLVLDEIQVRSDTEWEDVILTDLIDRRYAAMKSTLMIANLTPKDFCQRIGSSVTSRLTETGGIIVCDWPSFRKPAA